MREKNGRAKRYKESGGQFKHWKSPLSAHSKGTGKGSAFQCCFIAPGKWFRHQRKAGLATVPSYCSSGPSGLLFRQKPLVSMPGLSQAKSGRTSAPRLQQAGRAIESSSTFSGNTVCSFDRRRTSGTSPCTHSL